MINIFSYLIISLGINIIMFIPAFKLKTDKFTDISYSLSFIILILTALYLNPFSMPNLIVALMIATWALRLGIFLFIRIGKMKKDKRFDGLRESFARFLKFWVLQGVAVWVILVPALFFINSESKIIFWIGFIIWFTGFTIETISDYQKYRFKQDKKNKGRFINIGLWKYSRHPNYFGEMLCWIGVYITVFLSLSRVEKVIGIVSPLFITVLLLFVTGLPLLEKYADNKWRHIDEYKEYKRNTSILIPWIPRK